MSTKMVLHDVSADIEVKNTGNSPILPTKRIEESLALGGMVYNSMPFFVSKESLKGCILTEGSVTGGTGNISLEFVTISLSKGQENS